MVNAWNDNLAYIRGKIDLLRYFKVKKKTFLQFVLKKSYPNWTRYFNFSYKMQKKGDFQLDFLKTVDFSWLQFSILTEFDHENIKIEIYVKIFIKFHTSFIKNRSKFAKILEKKFYLKGTNCMNTLWRNFPYKIILLI